jgi:DNA polymerase-3 subunit alpha
VPLPVLNKKTLEALIKAGAFDSLGHPRRGLLAVFEGIVDRTVARRREADMGVMTLFGELTDESGAGYDDRPAIPDLVFDKADKLRFEKEMLGLYVSDHPLMGSEAALRRRTDCSVSDLAEAEDGAIKLCGGVITALNRRWTRKGDLMAAFALEDLQGSIEVMVFPKAMSEVGHKLADDAIVVVKGRVDRRDDQPKLIAMEIDRFEPVQDAPPLRIKVAAGLLTDALVDKIKSLLVRFPGESPVYLHLGEERVLRLPDTWSVAVGSGLMGELRVLLGPNAIL